MAEPETKNATVSNMPLDLIKKVTDQGKAGTRNFSQEMIVIVKDHFNSKKEDKAF